MVFDNIVGYEAIKEELLKILDILANTEKYTKLGVKQPHGLLLHGKQGIGKTLFASNFIKASGRKCITCRKNKSNGDFVNEIKAIFDKASLEAPSIVFLDDLDKFSNEDDRHVNTEEFITVQTCIDEVKDKNVYVVATANSIDVLPASLIRDGRFDNKIYMTVPTGNDAREVVKYYLKKLSLMDNDTIIEVTKVLEGKSIAEIESIINESGINAGYQGRDKIETDDIIKAYLRKVYDTPCVTNCENNEYLKHVAYHEAGHTVVQETLESGTVNLVSIVNNLSDGKCGVTNYDQNEYYFFDKKFMENRIMSLLGGKAAIEIVYGTTDVGCNNDLHRAFNVATRFVDDYCSFDFSSFDHSSSSDSLKERVDNRVAQEMLKYYRAAKEIIIKNREFLDKVAELLLNKKIITQKDIARLK